MRECTREENMQISPSSATICIAAALRCREDGQTLLVRKRGTWAFMQPGAKIEPGETPVATLIRELREELGISLGLRQTIFLGRFVAPAANEPGFMMHADLFRVDYRGDVAPAAEIEEIAWVDPCSGPGLPLAPLTRDHVLPLFARQLRMPAF